MKMQQAMHTSYFNSCYLLLFDSAYVKVTASISRGVV